MALIAIAGTASCVRYAQAEFIAGILSNKLPHFTVRRLVIKENEWERWLWDQCQKNKWMQKKCPLVWRELAMPGGKPVLIGSLSEFLEFCHEYYGLSAMLSDEEKRMLVEDNMRIQEEERKKRDGRYYKVRKILVTGADPRILSILISELLNLKCLGRSNGTVINVFDKSKKRYIIDHIQKDSSLLGADAGLEAAQIIDNLQEGLKNCDIFIIFNAFTRDNETNFEQIFKKNYGAMLKLAKVIDDYAPPKCRVIIAGPEDAPLCFNATVLVNASQSLDPRKVVVVTAHLGAEGMATVTKLTQTKMGDFAAPAVWGFIGLNQYIDFDNMIYKSMYFVPNNRAIKRIPNSTLPQGKVITELRRFIYLMENIKKLWLYLQQFKTFIKETTAQPPELPKVNAIVTLLKLWYSREYDGEVISLGVTSDGSFGVPHGIVFSQPVVLRNRIWRPYTDYPKPDKKKCNLDNFINTAMYVMLEYANDCVFQYKNIWQYVDSDEIEAEEKQNRESRYKYPEFPNPFQTAKESRTRNEVGVARAMLRTELRWKLENEKDFAPLITGIQEGKNLYRKSSITMRMSFHSEESMLRREEEIQAAVTEANVKDVLRDIIRSIGKSMDIENKKENLEGVTPNPKKTAEGDKSEEKDEYYESEEDSEGEEV